MKNGVNAAVRIDQIRRIFEDFGFEQIDALQEWGGHDLEELREFLNEEEFQALLDELELQDGYEVG